MVMKVSLHRGWIFPIVGVLIIIISGLIITAYIEKAIKKIIFERNGKVASVNANLLTRSIRLNDFQWYTLVDSIQVYSDTIIIKKAHAQGIHIIDLLLHQKLVMNKLVLDGGIIDMNTSLAKNNSQKPKPAFSDIVFKTILLNNLHVQIQDSSGTYTGLFNCKLTDAVLKNDSVNQNHFSVEAVESTIKNVRIAFKGGMYSSTIKQVHISSNEERVIIDSVLLIPAYGKDEFAKVAGNQVARISLSIPKLIVNQFQFQKFFNRAFTSSKITIESFDLYTFKDKRIPFVQAENRAMPMESFIKLPFSIKVDSITIHDSHIVIEEIQQTSTTSGTLTFDHVNATFAGLNNRITGDGSASADAVLKANALVMNAGSIQATFTFPQDGSPTYTVKGTISKMELNTLNPMLENMVNIHIESGYLNNLAFNFSYTDYVSKGVLDVAYENLNITALDKNESTINEIKTFLINLFTKEDKRKVGLTSKHTGVIDIKRNRKRYIFNVWWKSMLDGLKSSMGGNKKRNRDRKKNDANAS